MCRRLSGDCLWLIRVNRPASRRSNSMSRVLRDSISSRERAEWENDFFSEAERKLRRETIVATRSPESFMGSIYYLVSSEAERQKDLLRPAGLQRRLRGSSPKNQVLRCTGRGAFPNAIIHTLSQEVLRLRLMMTP